MGSTRAFKRIVPSNSRRLDKSHVGKVAYFLLKVVSLEAVRRVSRARCPYIWSAIQGLQVLCYPPFSWLERWAPVRFLLKGLQTLSRPLLLLSVTTTLLDHSEKCKEVSRTVDDLQNHLELSEEATSDIAHEDDFHENADTAIWLVNLRTELEKHGIALPERINYDELRRFHAAADGDFTRLLSSLKKTIRWRENYNILSSQELEMWSDLVFWHGFDVMLRPCLIIRLGLASSILMPHDRPRFMQAIVSQIEHGVLHLMDGNDSWLTVLIDCEGLSPLRFPMHMMKSGSVLVQDHYPNCLGTLLVIRIPAILQDLAQAFIQALKPATRQKVRVEGETSQNAVSEILHSVPAFLGGDCKCAKCEIACFPRTRTQFVDADSSNPHLSDLDGESADACFQEDHSTADCEHVLRIAIIAFLLLWVFLALFSGTHELAPNFLFHS